MKHLALKGFMALTFMVLGVVKANPVATKTYNVTHTDGEWFNIINGISYVQQRVQASDMPANQAFVCDSILQAQKNDIYKQVSTALQAENAAATKAKEDSLSKIKKP